MIVVDASVACKWFFDEKNTSAALEILRSAQPLIAPDLIVAEVASVVARHIAANDVSAEDGQTHLAALAKAIDRMEPLGGLAPLALAMAVTLGRPVYDCFYLALAEQHACVMVTADAMLARRVKKSTWRARIRSLDSRD